MGNHTWDDDFFRRAWQRGAELQHEVHEILGSHNRANTEMAVGVEKLANTHGIEIYSELFFHLCRSNLPPLEAEQEWRELITRRSDMEEALGESIDLRVALVSLLTRDRDATSHPLILDVHAYQELESSVSTDDLTGLHNFRYLESQLNHEVRRAHQSGYTLSVVVLDLDDFKFYNDRNGHLAGNEILIKLGAVLKRLLRPTDVAARYGGEEFVIVYPATSKQMAREQAEKIREELASTNFPNAEHQPLGHITASMGLATYPVDANSSEQLLQRADAAMYTAKRSGKNALHLYGENRRSHQRVPVRINGQIKVAANEIRFETRDISESGLSFSSPIAIETAALIDIRLELTDGAPVICAARVVRVLAKKDGEYTYGVHFITPDSDDHRRLVQSVRATKQSTAKESLTRRPGVGKSSP